VTGFGGVFAVVLAQLVAGGLVLTWCSPLWRESKRTYFTIHGAITALLFALPLWLIARASADGSAEADRVVTLALVTLALVAVGTLCAFRRWWPAARAIGFASTVAAVATLLAFTPLGDRGTAPSVIQLAAGAAFLGASYDALFLGHWYLTDRKLTRRPILRYTVAMIAASAVEVIVIVATGFSGGRVSGSLNPILAAGDVAPWIGVGMAVATLLIAVMARAALRGERASAVQSATGFFYLGVITALVAAIAVTTRFFPA
jgi:hypothetical protein